MTPEMLKEFFFWCMIINSALYAVTAIALLLVRGVLVRLYAVLFGMNEQEMLASFQRYLAGYKLLITVFNFAPWAALLIIT